MPIQFRCTGCRQKLAISRRKAGKKVKCPACATELQVPTLEDAAARGQVVEPVAEPEVSPAPPAEEQLAAATTEPTPPADDFFSDLPPDAIKSLYDDELEAPDPAAEPSAAATAEPEPEVADDIPEGVAELSPGPVITSPQPEATIRQWTEDDEEEDEDFQLTRRPPDDGGLDMTPMVDVTFLLLIFFMITASFSIQKSMEAEPPDPSDEGAAQMPTMDDLADSSVIVEIDENDVIYVDDVQVGSIQEVVDELALKVSSEQKLEMIIEAHPQSKHGTVVQVTDAGIEVGMQRIRRTSRSRE